MSLSSSLLSAVSGLQTSQRQMQVTSGNVSNANVEGYSRKTASAVTNVTGGQNSGVELSQIKREVNDYLNSEVRRTGTKLSALNAESKFLTRVTEMFGTLQNDSTLSNGLNNLASSFEALGVDPESATVQNDVVEAANAVARQFNDFSRETQNLRVEADRQIDQAVTDINSALSRIAELNEEISRGQALGEPIAEFKDERDRQLTKVTERMDVSSFERSTGELVVVGKTDDTSAGGDEGNAHILVDSSAVQFSFQPSNALDADTSGNLPQLKGAANTALNVSAGGKLGKLIEMRDTTLTNYHDELDQLAAEVRDRINAAHNKGTFGNDAATTITGTTDVSNEAALSTTGTFTINEVDSSGAVVNTIDIDTGGAPFNAGPGTAAEFANDINAVYGSNIASITGQGQLELQAPSGNDITIDTGDAKIDGDYGSGIGLSHYFGLNNLFQTPNVPSDPATDATEVADAAGVLMVRSDIQSDPELLSRGTAIRTQTPNEAPAVAAGDNSVAQKLAGAFDETGSIPAAGDLPQTDTTLTGYAADILSFHASQAEQAEQKAEFQESLHSELKFRAESESGVNIDEELSNVVIFEQAYNASARVISTVQQMFDTLDRMMN